ncbi:hypothetical protein FVA95_28635 [Pseudonocardia sp. EV170527-09]|uniref:hypothetical protein n=1 Tax=Pseudonocardia sp. EV170527-09 TaxID=2603411 RepID=UPI0011F3D111|nr:hypothetical protein [Pseudonocardia sp. EV170527-09]KAA1007638.1 hypothetical protein FVA95_28635 [Pseudonocardia sp. EV170527-09]
MTESDTVAERKRAILQWFVIRARRVEEHSLAQDKDKLLTWAQATLTLSGIEGEPPSELRWSLPPEEQLDSLAARCRPFLLKGDSVYWANVTTALGYLVRNETDPELPEAVEKLRDAWKKLDRDSADSLGFESRAGGVDGVLGDMVSSKALAFAWLYGDLVHADEDIPERVGEHGIDDRYRAGAILITNVARCVIMTLNVVRALQSRGIANLPAEVFEQRVVADPDAKLRIARSIMAPVGTSVEDLDKAMDKAAE